MRTRVRGYAIIRVNVNIACGPRVNTDVFVCEHVGIRAHISSVFVRVSCVCAHTRVSRRLLFCFWFMSIMAGRINVRRS